MLETITNVDLLEIPVITKQCFQNIRRALHEFLFQKYSKDILEYYNVMEMFYEGKKFEKLFCGLSCENFSIGSFLSWNVFLNFIETVFHGEQGA